MPTISAIYEGGVFQPLQKVDLPDATEVTLEVSHSQNTDTELMAVYEVLSRRFEGGNPDDAARHNEHQP